MAEDKVLGFGRRGRDRSLLLNNCAFICLMAIRLLDDLRPCGRLPSPVWPMALLSDVCCAFRICCAPLYSMATSRWLLMNGVRLCA